MSNAAQLTIIMPLCTNKSTNHLHEVLQEDPRLPVMWRQVVIRTRRTDQKLSMLHSRQKEQNKHTTKRLRSFLAKSQGFLSWSGAARTRKGGRLAKYTHTGSETNL